MRRAAVVLGSVAIVLVSVAAHALAHGGGGGGEAAVADMAGAADTVVDMAAGDGRRWIRRLVRRLWRYRRRVERL